MKRSKKRQKPTIGWREWVAFPEWGIDRLKAKIDTGAASSSLHANHVRIERRGGAPVALFDVLVPRDATFAPVNVETEIVEFREVRSSNGHVSRRPLIVTDIELMGRRWPIYMTLANRETMAFPMLLGRRCLRGRFNVDVAKSFRGARWAEHLQRRGPLDERRPPASG